MEKTSIKTNTTTKDKTGFTSAELEEKFLKITKHTAKDSVFRDLFGNTKYLLELYQILHPEDTDIKEGDIIDQYIKFTRVFNDQVRIYGYTRKAVMETIGICKNKNVLKEYLESREKEVVDIMSILFDDEYIMRLYVEDKVQEAREEAEKELKEATEKAVKEAAEEAKRKNREMTKKLFSMGMDVQKIADVIDVEPSQVEEWIGEDQSEECVIKK